VKKIIFICLFIFGVILISCAGSDNKPDEAIKQTEIEETAETVMLKLPPLDFGNEEVNFLLVKEARDYYTSFEIYAGEQTGGLINDSVYSRNIVIEDLLNIKINGTWSLTAYSDASKSLTANETAYDVVMTYMHDTISLAQQGFMMDLLALKYLDLEKPWWDQRANDNLMINGKLFLTTGDLSILDKDCTMAIFFNKKMVSDYELESPYQLVFDNKWTIDKVFEMGGAVTEDVNGDGKLGKEDQWGLTIASNAPHSMFFGAGERIAKNVNGELQIVMYNPRSVDVLDKIFGHVGDLKIYTNRIDDTSYATVNKMFLESRAMIVTYAVVSISDIKVRDAEFEFGILPYPLYDETQDGYNNFISTSLVASTSVPYNCRNTDMVGAALEAMAYYSTDTLKVAYYDTALKTRYARDNESGDMLDIIFATRVYDMGYIYNWGGIGNLIESMYTSRKNTFSSEYEKIEEKALTAMQKTIDEFIAIK